MRSNEQAVYGFKNNGLMDWDWTKITTFNNLWDKICQQ